MQRGSRRTALMLILIVGLVLVVGVLYVLGAPRAPQDVERPVELELIP